MNITFISVIYFIAFSHALMLSIALWQRTAAGKPGRILAIVVAILAYKLFEGGSAFSGFYRYVPHLLDLMPAMVMVLGPVFYGYIRKVTGQKSFGWREWLLHLLPWMGVWVFLNSPSVFRAAELKIAMWESINTSSSAIHILPTEIVLRLLAIKAHLTLYLFLSWRNLQVFAQSIKQLRSDNSTDIVVQLKMLTTALILLEVVWVSLFLAQQYAGLGTLDQVSQVWLLFIAGIVLAMGFSGLQKPDLIFTPEERLLSNISTSENDSIEGTSTKVKYIHSALPESASNEIANEIEQALEHQQLYLGDKFTLTDLAKVLEMKSHTLSQVINQHMQTNFYKLINSYRVNHAVTLLEDLNVNWSIERIALESGFSNRVTFNKAFKEIMQCTASNYKKKHRAVS